LILLNNLPNSDTFQALRNLLPFVNGLQEKSAHPHAQRRASNTSTSSINHQPE